VKNTVLITVFILLSYGSALGICNSSRILNPLTDVCWSCMFPIKLGQQVVSPGSSSCDLPVAGNEMPVCECPIPLPPYKRIGLSTSFWEPAKFIETVKDSWCFPSLMTQAMTGMNNGTSRTSSNSGGSQHIFQQAHYMTFPVDLILEGIISAVCFETTGFDIGYVTELDPLWNDDVLAAIIEPEAVLFSNIFAQTACSVDAVASTAGCSLAALPWCSGSWGSVYPQTGNVGTGDYMTGNALIAAKLLFKVAKMGMVCDPGVWNCFCVPTPTWIKTNYRMHLAMPIRDVICHPIGRTEMIWSPGKNPPVLGENFVWMLWRKRGCCAF
jgi:conjugal transfer pilus assembly protein TraU